MKSRFPCALALAALTLLLSMPASAAEGAPKPPARTDLAAPCAKEAKAKGLEGKERDRFVERCAERATVAASAQKPESQQERMKWCNAEARGKDLHGEERRAFMSACLRG